MLLLNPNNGRGHKNLSYALLNVGRVKKALMNMNGVESTFY